MNSAVSHRSRSTISAAWRSGSDEQIVLEYVLFEAETQHKHALKQLVEAECRAQNAVVALRSAETHLLALSDVHDEELRQFGRHYSEREIHLDISVENAENSLLQVLSADIRSLQLPSPYRPVDQSPPSFQWALLLTCYLHFVVLIKPTACE